MSKNWVIAPYYSGWDDAFNKVWEFDLEHGIISIGWGGLGDVSGYTIDQLKPLFNDPRDAHQVYKFYHAIKEGDTVVARWGRSWIAGVGKVTRTAYYDPDKTAELFKQIDPEEVPYPHHIEVEWDEEWRDIDCERQAFGIRTLQSISTEDLDNLLYDFEDEYDDEFSDDSDEEFELPTVSQQVEFVLEKHLEDFIVSNFDQLFGGELTLLTDDEGNPKGRQVDTKVVGRIDLLCQDIETGDYVVMELKKGRPADKVVGQLLRYMGWVKEKLCSEGQNVRGMVICKDSDEKLKYALSTLPNVSIKYFRVDFELGDEPFGEA